MPVNQPRYPLDPNSLDVLKRYLSPTGKYLSENVVENDPELAFPIPKPGGFISPSAELAGYDRVKKALGLGPSHAMQEQQKELDARDAALSNARISAEPEVAAQTEKALKDRLTLAGEPNRVSGEAALRLEKQKQEPLNRFMEQQNQTPNDPNAMHFRPNVSENGISFTGVEPDKLNSQQQALVDSAHQISSLGIPLLAKYEARYPGIASNPKKYGSPISDTLSEKLTKGAYSFGGMTDNDALLQDAAAIQAWGVKALASGRITKPLMEMISAHLPQPGFSPGANYDRLHRLLTDILPAQLQGIDEGRGANKFSLHDISASDPYRDPNYQPR